MGRVDPQGLEVEAEAGVERDVEREERRRPEAEAAVEQEQRPGGEEVPERLVEERRVEGLVEDVLVRPACGVDLEPPGQLGRLAEELLVPPVADAADRLRDEEPRRGGVEEGGDARAGPAGDDAADDDAAGDPAPDPEPALPDGERPPPLVRNLVPARREVVEPGADDAGADAPDGDAEDQIPVAAARDPAHAGDRDARGDPGQQHQAVHVDRHGAEVERARGR